MKKIVASRLTINTRVRPVNISLTRAIVRLEKEKKKSRRERDTHIQVPGTVEAAVAAAIISDRSITSRPLLRIVIFSPCKHRKKNITILYSQSVCLNNMRSRINYFITKDRCALAAVSCKSGLAATKKKRWSRCDGEIKVKSMHHGRCNSRRRGKKSPFN